MGSTDAVLIAQDTTAQSGQPSLNVGSTGTLAVLGGAGPVKVGYIQAPTPAVVATVLSARLRIRQQGAASAGNRTLSLYRITSGWREDLLTWNSRPSRAAAASASAVVNGAGADGRVVEFDVTADVQAFFDRALPNYGWTIESNAAQQINFRSSESAINAPELIVQWAETPERPTDLLPGGGVVVGTGKPLLRWAFVDLGGDTSIAGLQVHLKTTNTGWTEAAGYSSPTYDTGVLDTTQPQVDLATTGYPGLAAGGSVWWTIRHRDGAGLWSDWSDPQQFTYQPHQAVTLAYPASGVVEDTTFPVRWDAAAQTRYQVDVTSADQRVLWTSGPVTSSTARQVQVPRSHVPAGVAVTVAVRVWDQYQRQDQPTVPAYATASRTVTVTETTDVAAVANLQVVASSEQPSVDLTWSRSAAPAYFAVWVDGVEHIVDTAAAFKVGATTYAYRLDGLAKNVEHTFTVKAIAETTSAGTTYTRTSANNPTAVGTVTPVGVWLIDVANPGNAVRFLQAGGTTDIVTTTMPETTFAFEPVGATNAVVVTTALRAMEGSVTGGVLADYGNLTAAELHSRLMGMKSRRLGLYRLMWGTQALDVRISDVDAVSTDEAVGQERYVCSLNFRAANPPTDYLLT